MTDELTYLRALVEYLSPYFDVTLASAPDEDPEVCVYSATGFNITANQCKLLRVLMAWDGGGYLVIPNDHSWNLQGGSFTVMPADPLCFSRIWEAAEKGRKYWDVVETHCTRRSKV